MQTTLPKGYISNSQLNCYISCPQQYYQRYIAKEVPSNYTNVDNLLIGLSFHNFIAKNLKNIPIEDKNEIFFFELNNLLKDRRIQITDEIKYSEYLDTNNKNLLKDALTQQDYQYLLVGYEEVLKTKTVIRPSALTIYNNLVDYFIKKKKEILQDIDIESIEETKTFNFIDDENNKQEIKAVFDLIGFNKKTFKSIIIDWKTASKSWCDSKALKKQDMIYSYLANGLFEEIPEFYYYIFIFSQSTGEIKLQKIKIQHTEQSISLVEQDIKDIVNGIKNEIFFKNDSFWGCSRDYCEFFDGCQNYKNEIKVEISKEE